MSKRPAWPGWRAALRELAGSGHSPGRLAAALALGAAIAPTPVLGLHTWMAIGLALPLRLNPLAAFAGSNLANPLTMAPLVWIDVQVGARLLGRPPPPWPGGLDWAWLGQRYLEAWVGALGVGAVLAAAVYAVALPLLRRARRS